MEYTGSFNRFKSLFRDDASEILIPDSDIRIHNVGFRSEMPSGGFINDSDKLISENSCFSYPVFSPGHSGSERVILLFHGLNERSWIKYLTWGYKLAEQTGSYVVLFPISFHINRSPAAWRDPRAMVSLMKVRNSSIGEVDMSSFANIALSNRLSEDPMRFFRSGYQTVQDIIRLTAEIRSGKHPVIPETDRINIFSYSIGAFLAEILMIGNPGNLFSDSKLFIFSGGSVFSNMKGASKFIMDKRAFDLIYNFYMNDFERSITGRNQFADYLRTNPLAIAFRSMIDLGRFRSFRETRFRKLKDQIATITLSKDTVIPSDGVVATLGNFYGRERLKVLDLPFAYSHENPFPLFESPLSKKVDYWFEKIFSEAALFLA